jgi:hypothetical protein
MAPHAHAPRILATAAAIVLASSACKPKRDSSAASVDAAPRDAAQAESGTQNETQNGSNVRSAGPPPAIPPGPPDDQLPAASEGMAVRARHLLEAIASDDAALASDILFPRDGWTATRDAPDPGKDWDRRVASPFRRAVHVLSRRHEDYSRAQSVSLELGPALAQETPRPRSWKKPVWTARGSRVTFVVDGHARTLPLRELTAWRGEWYVTRLR